MLNRHRLRDSGRHHKRNVVLLLEAGEIAGITVTEAYPSYDAIQVIIWRHIS
jgi:hypothetical protein